MVGDKDDNTEEVVQVPMDAYQALLDEVEDQAKMIEDLKSSDESGTDELDDLLGDLDSDQEEDLGKGKERGKEEKKEGNVQDEVAKQVHPVLVRVIAMDINNQVKDLKSELAKEGKDDFEEVKAGVLKVGKKFPNMTVKEAYTHYKASPEGKAREAELKESDKDGSRKNLLRHLPRPHSERPGPGSGVKAGEEENLSGKEAAAAAYDKVFG